MADIKGKLNVSDLIVDSSGTINNKNIVTSVNDTEANEQGKINLTTIGILQKKSDLNSVTKSEFYFFDENALGAPTLNAGSEAQGLTLDMPGLSTELAFIPGGEQIKFGSRFNTSESKNPNAWSQWKFIASEDWVKDYVLNNGGTGSTDSYTKDESDDKFLPITSNKDATVGKLTLKNEHEYPGIVYEVSSTGNRCGIEGTRGKGFLFWADDTNGTRNMSIKMPLSTGTVATQEWTQNLLHSRVVFNTDNTEILPQALNKAGFYTRVGLGGVEIFNGTASRFKMIDNATSFGNNVQIRTNFQDTNKSIIEIVSPDAKQNIVLSSFNNGIDVPKLSVLNGGLTNHIKLNVESGTLATREWTNQYVRSGAANTETILQARDGGESFVFVRSSDMNIGMYLNGSTKFRIKETAITTESGCRALAINGKSNSGNDRPQLILDSVVDLWRIEPDGTGKLQIIHPATGALYEFEKVGGTQQVASKQWVNAQGFSKGSQAGRYNKIQQIVWGADLGDGGSVNLPFDCRGVPMYFQDSGGDFMNMIIFPVDNFQVMSNSGAQGCATMKLENGGTRLRLVYYKNAARVNNVWVSLP